MEKKIEINGKMYSLKTIDFNAICDLEAKGLSINNVENRVFASIRALVSFVTDLPIPEAGKELEGDITNFDGKCIEPLMKMYTESDFFKRVQSVKVK